MSRLVGSVLVACSIGCASAGDPSQIAPGVDAPTGGMIDAPMQQVDAPPMMDACTEALERHAQDFEMGPAGWTHVVLDNAEGQATWPFDEWQVGAATFGPSGCHAGNGCWATRLDANYTSCSRAALLSPTFDLSACSGRTVDLKFWSWHDFWTGVVSGSSTTWFDGGLVEFSTTGTAWSPVTPSPGYTGTIDINPNIGGSQCVLPNSFYVDGKPGFVGNGGGWKQITVPIPAAMLTSTFRLRFAYSSGVSFASTNAETNRMHTRPGWYIDELVFSAN